MIRLAQVEWRMRRSTADLCPKQAADVGIAIDYIGAYEKSDRKLVRASTGLGDKPQVIAVVADSPAHSAGLQQGDEIVGLNGIPAEKIASRSGADTLLADDIQDWIAGQPTSRVFTITIRREGTRLTLPMKPVRVCSARFILHTDKSVEAYSDGENIALTTGIMRFAESDDEIALIAGHELAHVISGEGKSFGLFGQRRIEDKADMLGARLARCAGYDLPRAFDFWTRFAQKDWLGFLRDPTHRTARGREKRLRAAKEDLTCPV